MISMNDYTGSVVTAGTSGHRPGTIGYRPLDIPAMYLAAAERIERQGLADPGDVVTRREGVDFDSGRLSVDAACRLAVGLPAREADVDMDDAFAVARFDAVIGALRIDLRCLPARWDGTELQTVHLLRAAARARAAQRRIQAPPVEVAA